MTEVMFWQVNSTTETTLSISQSDICRFLVSDWLPTLPFSVARSVLGWPYFLIRQEQGATPSNYWVIEPFSGWSDRQWKGVLSWMLGIAGTRKVLDREHYQWIAPCSAFYPERKRMVAIPNWHVSYPPSVLEIYQDQNNSSRLRPDYIAARSLPTGDLEFALVESKGTANSLVNTTSCPNEWANQVRNGVVTINNVRARVHRHIVVATRCNPNSVREKTRRLQIRAWNSNSTESEELLGRALLIELLSAHYFSLCKNLGLHENQRSLSAAVSHRHDSSSISQDDIFELSEVAENEFGKYIEGESILDKGAFFTIQHDIGLIHIHLSSQAIILIRHLRTGEESNEVFNKISEHLLAINNWFNVTFRQYEKDGNVAVDRSGFLVKIADKRMPNNSKFT